MEVCYASYKRLGWKCLTIITRCQSKYDLANHIRNTMLNKMLPCNLMCHVFSTDYNASLICGVVFILHVPYRVPFKD